MGFPLYFLVLVTGRDHDCGYHLIPAPMMGITSGALLVVRINYDGCGTDCFLDLDLAVVDG
jgi:hypothetical protein